MITGRKRELKLLNKVYNSNEAEFLAVYGRRRVGKTYLIREFFSSKKCRLLHATGVQNGSQKNQLKKFIDALSEAFLDKVPLETPKNWSDAFDILDKQLSKQSEKVVVFLDELPWMATRKSGLLEELDYYWNRNWVKMPNIILVVCGSSASWLIKKIINNKGGLHNRVTQPIRLLPFSLSETEEFLKSRNITLNRNHVLSLYMALGGIPYYLKYAERGLTSAQNIQNIFFEKNSPLKNEFDKLFQSLFENAEAYIELIKLISKRKEGVRRAELKDQAKLSSGGGRLTKRLQDLEEAGFIDENIPWGRVKGEYYKLIDEFCLFYLQWIDSQKQKQFTRDYWLNQSQRPAYYAWSGYAFEAVCMKHIDQIVHALNIKASGKVNAWRYIPREKTKEGAQIDLVIDRNDHAITLCEIKYTEQEYSIDKRYSRILKNKLAVFKEKTGVKKQLFLAMICTNGLKKTGYFENHVDGGVVTLEDLFCQLN
ncbi:MAG TPA: ATP-binding protein [Gammaproteobacteria bacterium]|nr:ATP-binding protein [Gammaproteobacteria bacterium]